MPRSANAAPKIGPVASAGAPRAMLHPPSLRKRDAVSGVGAPLFGLPASDGSGSVGGLPPVIPPAPSDAGSVEGLAPLQYFEKP